MCGSNINPTRTIYQLPEQYTCTCYQHNIIYHFYYLLHIVKSSPPPQPKKNVTGSYVSITRSISFTYIQSSLFPFLVSFITYLLIIVEN